jgi:PAS domain-containing protein
MSDQALKSVPRVPAFDDMEPEERRTAFERLLRENLGLRQDLDQRAGERTSLQVLIDQVPDFLFVEDLEGRFVIANGATGRATGALGPVNCSG